MNTEDTQLQILKTLAQADGHPLAQDVLVLQVEARVRPRPTRAGIHECITSMQHRGLVLSQPNELAESNPYWLLDEKGQALATRMRL